MTRQLLVISRGLIHPSPLCRRNLKKMLESMEDDFSFQFSGNLHELNYLNQKKYAAVILYYHEKKIDDAALEALLNYVNEGGGVLALHSAMASFKENRRYQSLLGGKFTGHDKVENIDIIVKNKEHGISREVNDFSVKDELYIHAYDENNEIIMVSDNKGHREPVLWTKNFGKGKVCYFSPGHCPRVWQNTEVKKIIRNALHWLCEAEDQNE